MVGFFTVLGFLGVFELNVCLAYRDSKTNTKQAKTKSAITKKSLVRLIDWEVCGVSDVPGVGSEITAGALKRNVKLPVIGDSPTAIIV